MSGGHRGRETFFDTARVEVSSRNDTVWPGYIEKDGKGKCESAAWVIRLDLQEPFHSSAVSGERNQGKAGHHDVSLPRLKDMPGQ
jgi:hypothetical protein